LPGSAQTDDNANDREAHRLQYDLPGHAAHGSAERDANSNLGPTLRDEIRDDAIRADGAQRQRDGGGDAKQDHHERGARHGLREHFVHRSRVYERHARIRFSEQASRLGDQRSRVDAFRAHECVWELPALPAGSMNPVSA
jgi:hypothetical protein